jgi:hypothetical protein
MFPVFFLRTFHSWQLVGRPSRFISCALPRIVITSLTTICHRHIGCCNRMQKIRYWFRSLNPQFITFISLGCKHQHEELVPLCLLAQLWWNIMVHMSQTGLGIQCDDTRVYHMVLSSLQFSIVLSCCSHSTNQQELRACLEFLSVPPKLLGWKNLFLGMDQTGTGGFPMDTRVVQHMVVLSSSQFSLVLSCCSLFAEKHGHENCSNQSESNIHQHPEFISYRR